MPVPWWNRTKTCKVTRLLRDSQVKLASGPNVPIKKGAIISPVRKSYLPYGHRFTGYYDETTDMVADTPVGFGMIKLEDIEW